MLCVVKAIRVVWGEKPLFVRLSASYRTEGPEENSGGGLEAATVGHRADHPANWRAEEARR
jgi:hypothetical protein